jgi:hypothetical protein
VTACLLCLLQPIQACLQVLWAGLPGTESGHALTDVLYGYYNPSGRLPYTIAKQATDYPTQINLGTGLVEIPYTEGCVVTIVLLYQVSLTLQQITYRLSLVRCRKFRYNKTMEFLVEI